MVLNTDHYAAFSIQAALQHFAISIELANIETKDICNDSRQVKHDDIFAAVSGTAQTGSAFIKDAVSQGAALVLCQSDTQAAHGEIQYQEFNLPSGVKKTIPVIWFYQLAENLADVSAYYYGQPSNDVVLTGITGTNGKTSCSLLVAQLLEAMGQRTGIIGTMGAGTLDHLVDINNTTPGPTKLQQLLAQFKAEQIKQVAMEVSSHALSQRRVNKTIIDIAVFTNLSRDHLDYHADMQDYANAKKQLFIGNDKQIHILNADDDVAVQWLTEFSGKNRTVLFSCEPQHVDLTAEQEYLFATNIQCHQQGVTFSLQSSWGNSEIHSSLLGAFNVSNLLATIAVLLVQGFELEQIAKFTNSLTPVAGRMEAFMGAAQPTAVVDYAHTPDGLEKALQSVQGHCKGELWLVFGCGGDRDSGKRPLMGAIAEQYASHIIVTNDNPRTESPQKICDDILAGMKTTENVQVILDREQAVLTALKQAKPQDMVLCAGKGHEDYTIIGHEKIAYHERELVRTFYQSKQAKELSND